ncbi:MerR family transcriptional regulator [Candidatus Obscuribacterales bacterium]|nr:MerR family transcriptional regulator [Candidatus Obscuribacterales bacterium]MBX3152758.1 MerR family transcriptional regulator [Candidatus Obscuribacterales bacterium]
MVSQDHMMSINTVAARLGLSVHQLRRWELMFGLEIKRGRGQQRQYRPEDLTILERIKELVEQGWPTSQIRPQIEAEGLITPKLIGMPTPPGNPEVVLESLIGMRTFCERRFIEISRQIDELRQLVISLSLKQELSGETDSPWQPMEPAEPVREEPRPVLPPQEITLGPEIRTSAPPPHIQAAAAAAAAATAAAAAQQQSPSTSATQPTMIGVPSSSSPSTPGTSATPGAPATPGASAPPPPAFTAAPVSEAVTLGEVTDQNYLTVLGRALDLIGWTDEEADEYSEKTFGIPHWDELGRSQAERLVAHLVTLINAERQPAAVTPAPMPPSEPAAEMSFHATNEEEMNANVADNADGEGDEFYDEDDFDTTPGGTGSASQPGSAGDSSHGESGAPPPPPSPPYGPPA